MLLLADGTADESSKQVDFEDGEKWPLESVGEYSVGFWSRYLTAIPKRQILKPQIMQMVRVTTNRASGEGSVQHGDRVLSVYI